MVNTFATPSADRTISNDLMLKEPRRINQFISDMTSQGLFADRVFGTPLGVTGGAVMFTTMDPNDVYADRSVQNVEPGTEYPTITSAEKPTRTAYIEKFGGRFSVTDEARERNRPDAIHLPSRQLANTMAREINRRAVYVLDKAVEETGATVPATSWLAATELNAQTARPSEMPAADFAKVSRAATSYGLGIVPDLWIVHPNDLANFRIAYGIGHEAVPSNWGVELLPSLQVPEGEAYAVAAGQVGIFGSESPLTTSTYRENERDVTWVQASVRMLFAVTTPHAVIKVTGLNAQGQ